MKIDRHTTKISIAKEVMPAKRERGKYIQKVKKGEVFPMEVDKTNGKAGECR